MRLPAPVALTFARVGVSALVLAGGFRAVSDDDFARVVIAERWAAAPGLDPSGTSWLPFPFYVTGAVMAAMGRTLDAARAVAILLGVASTLLVYVAVRWLGESRAASTGAALAASFFPWSARLGVATVPELPTAALTLLGIAALAGPPRRRLVGGVALLCATLSRYEAWPVAATVALLCLRDAARSRDEHAPASSLSSLGGAALALAGPVAWMAWNRSAHGDALHFLARVAAYRRALGGVAGVGDGVAARLVAYPLALAREAPEVGALLAAGVLLAATQHTDGPDGPTLRDRLAPYARPAALAVGQIVALSIAMVKDGAPTHHPERAVLLAMLLGAAVGGALIVHALEPMEPRRRALTLGAVALVVGAAGLFGGGRASEAFVRRGDEEAIGRAARGHTRPREIVLLEVVDYGHLAVIAAIGRPEDTLVDRSVDPREATRPSSFSTAATLRDRIDETQARWVIARRSEIVVGALGAPIATEGAWGLYPSIPR